MAEGEHRRVKEHKLYSVVAIVAELVPFEYWNYEECASFFCRLDLIADYLALISRLLLRALNPLHAAELVDPIEDPLLVVEAFGLLLASQDTPLRSCLGIYSPVSRQLIYDLLSAHALVPLRYKLLPEQVLVSLLHVDFALVERCDISDREKFQMAALIRYLLELVA